MTEIQQNIHYVMAVIKVPMLRQLNGSFDSLSDHTTVSFEMIDDLPTKPDYKVDNNYIKLKLNEMFAEPPIALRKPSFTPSHIIKNDVTVTFGRGEDNKAAQYAVLARGQGFEPIQKVGVHSQTLKAVVRERIEAGLDMPSDIFKTFAGNQTKITRR